MKKILIVLFIIALVPFVTSCFMATKRLVKDTSDAIGGVITGATRGTLKVVEGTSRGVAELG